MRWTLLAAGLFCVSTAAFLIWGGSAASCGSPAGSGQNPEQEKAGQEQRADRQAEEQDPAEGFSFHKLDDAVKKRITGISYKPGGRVDFGDLRYVKIRYYGFDGQVKDGELIVNKQIARDAVEIFYDLYRHRYPLQEVSLVDKYGGDDERSMAANNTSCFNDRLIAGTDKLSNHAYGLAIDVNPRINPCVGRQSADSVYAERDPEKCKGRYRAYMIQKDDYIYRLFQKHGFTWGGDWRSVRDYQHFEKPQPDQR